MRALLFLCAVGLPLAAQITGPFPGGSPYPGGGSNRYPNGGQTGPNGQQGSNRPTLGRRDKNGNKDAVVNTTEGMLRRATDNQIVIEAEDHRIVWYRVSDRIKYEDAGKELDPKALKPGDRVSVDGTTDEEGLFTATALTRRNVGSADDRARAAAEFDLPGVSTVKPRASDTNTRAANTPSRSSGDGDRPVLRRAKKPEAEDTPTPAAKSDQGPAQPDQKAEEAAVEPIDTRPTTTMKPADPVDPDKPVLKRGGPVRRKGPAPEEAPREEPVTVASSNKIPERANASPGRATETVASQKSVPGRVSDTSVIPIDEDPILSKAREAAYEYANSLPNYFAKQMTTRYESEDPKRGWEAKDVVSADIAYEDGVESYKNIKIGNKATNLPMDQIPGARSTGEFATLLNQLMEPQMATFRRGGTEAIHGKTAYVYKFEIPRERSHWRIEAPSQLYYPAYRGTIWIDKETSRVVRIEQEGRSLPLLFPFDTIETTADYDFVKLGTESYLLPVESEVLVCQRGTKFCSRNKIEFRNYRKFGSESEITFGNN